MTQTNLNAAGPPRRRGSAYDEDERDHSADLVLEAAAVLLLLLVFLALTAWASPNVAPAPTIGTNPLAWSTFTA
jgi:hypothetical protein